MIECSKSVKQHWTERWHHLEFDRPAPDAQPVSASNRWRVSWQGCAVMGILNVTPNSFSDGGQHLVLEAALEQAKRLQIAGALIIDIGGESTRPGAEPVDTATELDRVLPVIRELNKADILISIDTMKPEVAQAALKAGAHIVNDVTGLSNPQMVQVCAEFGAPACLMHMQGEPRTMQKNPSYQDVTAEVFGYLQERQQEVLKAGVPSVLLDPGIGFGKTLEHNLTLLRELPQLSDQDMPVLIGASRKRLIDWIAEVPNPVKRDPGSLALHLGVAERGAAVVRVHAVEEHVQALKVKTVLESPP